MTASQPRSPKASGCATTREKLSGWNKSLLRSMLQGSNKASDGITSHGTQRGAVRAYPTDDGLGNRFKLRVLDRDPHADAIPWPGPSVSSITEPINLGPFEERPPARVLFLRRRALFGGVSGSGKSGGLNVLMGNLAACHDVVSWAIDLKRGTEVAPWASCIDRIATTPSEAGAMLADAVAILEARAEMLAATAAAAAVGAATLHYR